jgi:hypothetical protein
MGSEFIEDEERTRDGRSGRMVRSRIDNGPEEECVDNEMESVTLPALI